MQLNGFSVPNVTALEYISHFLNSQLTSQITESVPSLDKVTRAVSYADYMALTGVILVHQPFIASWQKNRKFLFQTTFR